MKALTSFFGAANKSSSGKHPGAVDEGGEAREPEFGPHAGDAEAHGVAKRAKPNGSVEGSAGGDTPSADTPSNTDHLGAPGQPLQSKASCTPREQPGHDDDPEVLSVESSHDAPAQSVPAAPGPQKRRGKALAPPKGTPSLHAFFKAKEEGTGGDQ